MNNESTTNINSCSDFDDNKNINRIEDHESDSNLDQNLVWGTWEELLLAYAVKRHGFTAWDSVAEEIRSRTSLLVSPRNCRFKYQDLNRRFRKPSTEDDNGEGNSETVEGEDGVGEIPWLEELRNLREAELRREIQRSNVLIPSLELGLKKLIEKKDENDGDQKKPDLEENDESNLEKSKSNEIELAKINRKMTVSAAESDRENRSMNESNSTASNHERVVGDRTGPDPEPVAAETTEREEETVNRGPEMSLSGELDESGTSTGQVMTWSKKDRKYKSDGEDINIRGGSSGDNRSAGDKSQPLIDIIELIRSHPRGPLFETRLRSQKTKNYKRLIRQHLDIKTIEKKLKKGSYVSSRLSFYRDLKLLFTNVIVYYPTSSSESLAAHELRALVYNEIKKEPHKSSHKFDPVNDSSVVFESEPLISKQKSPDTLVACKTKNSSKKASPSSSSRQKEEKKPEEKEKILTGVSVRSSRRNNKAVTTVVTKTRNNKKHRDSRDSKDSKSDSSKDGHENEEETRKPEEKKGVVASDKKKSVANFLKRIGGKEASKDENKSHGNVKKDTIKVKPRELRSNSSSKKKGEVESISSLKRNSGKVTESSGTAKRGSKETTRKQSKEPKKRSRR